MHLRAILGGITQGRSAGRAARANIQQQEAALAFQEKQIQRGEKIAKGAFKFGREAEQLYQNIAQMRMANLQGQSFPMITQAGPQGNWAADAARLAMMSQTGGGGFTPTQLATGGAGMQAAGQALSGAGLGMFGAATQMAGQAMTSAATGGE